MPLAHFEQKTHRVSIDPNMAKDKYCLLLYACLISRSNKTFITPHNNPDNLFEKGVISRKIKG